MYGRSYIFWIYQLPPYSEIVHKSDGPRNTKGFFYFFLFFWEVFSALIAFWRRGVRRGHVSSSDWWGNIVSGECLFGFPWFSKACLLAWPFPFLSFPSFHISLVFSGFPPFFFFVFSAFDSESCCRGCLAFSTSDFLPSLQVRIPSFLLFSPFFCFVFA